MEHSASREAKRQISWRLWKSKYLTADFLKRFLLSLFKYVLLIGLTYIILYPFLVKLTSAFMSREDLHDPMVRFIPRNFSVENITFIYEYFKFPKAFINTLFLSTACALLQVVVSAMIGYGLARFKFKGKGIVFGMVIFTMVIPPQTIQLASYMKLKYFDIFGLINATTGHSINLVDSIWPMLFLSLTGLALKNGLYIFIMRQFFKNVPAELSEAASVDGAGAARTFIRIMLPMAGSMMLTIGLLSFSWQWLDTYYSSLLFPNFDILSNIVLRSGYISLASIEDIHAGTPASSMMINTATLMVMFPLMLLFLFAQKFFIQGVERSGIVG